MIKLIVDKLPRITKSKKKLEKELDITITNRGREIFIEGAAEQEFIAEKVIAALDFGFPFSSALELVEGEKIFEQINIKEHTNRPDLNRVRARIIGKNAKTIKTLSDLTKCSIELKDNIVGIIGDPELIQTATTSIISLIKGSKQGNVYAFLEKHQPKFEPDLGLRDKNINDPGRT